MGWNQIEKDLEQLIFFIMSCFNFLPNFLSLQRQIKSRWNFILLFEYYSQKQFVLSAEWTFFRVFMFTTNTDSVCQQVSKLAQVWILQDRKNPPTFNMKL